MPSLVLDTNSGSVELPPDCLVVFIDETGQEEFRDPNYPIFGLGGCAVQVDHFQRLVDLPWQYMKDRWFGGKHAPLHASELRQPTSEQLGALVHFFTKFQFCRIAAIVTDKTVLEVENPPFQLAATALMRRIGDVAMNQQFNSVALIFEASERGDPLAEKYFEKFEFFEGKRGSDSFRAPITKFIAPKSLLSGMEVADFVMHAAGTTVRTRHQKGGEPKNKDFKAVFTDVDARLTSFIEITNGDTEALALVEDPC